jgi:GDP-4-dehydro-6-deoxy-D-mannose reductase
MARTLVTGAAGMIGSHLVEALLARGERDVIGTSFRPTVSPALLRDRIELLELDIRDRAAVREAVAAARPAVIYHLAAQSLPTRSWTDPWDTIETNVQGTVNLFEAVREVRTRRDPGYDPMIVVACSSAEYGASLTPENLPIGEEAALLPLHPYGVSKVAQDLLAFQYWQGARIRCIRARLFNTTGPRKRNDVVSDFAARIACILRTGEGSLRVGNLDSRRAILDVRDCVAALLLLAVRGEPGEAYNICAETAWRIGDLIPIFERLAGRALKVEIDPALLRPTDEPVILGRTEKLRTHTGWRPAVPLEETLRAVLNDAIASEPP